MFRFSFSAFLSRFSSFFFFFKHKTAYEMSGDLSSDVCSSDLLALALAPPAALRYVLAHELCHLKVRNHSPRFWAQVEHLFPDWHEQRDWLRQHGAILKAELDRLIADVAD